MQQQVYLKSNPIMYNKFERSTVCDLTGPRAKISNILLIREEWTFGEENEFIIDNVSAARERQKVLVTFDLT